MKLQYPSPIVRSKSDVALSELTKFDQRSKPNYHEEFSSSASVLLAADTEHFGGDLVTQEHTSREKVLALVCRMVLYSSEYPSYRTEHECQSGPSLKSRLRVAS